jgi:hypothetical protein
MNGVEESKPNEESERKERLAGLFSEPMAFFNTLGDMRKQLEKLNANLEESSAVSDRLTRALHRIFLWGVIVASLGVLVAACYLGFEVYKFSKEAAVATDSKPPSKTDSSPSRKPHV